MQETPLATRANFEPLKKRRFATYVHPQVGRVRVRSLTEEERSQYEVESFGDRSAPETLIEAKSPLLCACIVDEDGNPQFSPDDVDFFRTVDGAVTGDLWEFCRQHCGFDKGDIERLVGNVEGGSSSGSP